MEVKLNSLILPVKRVRVESLLRVGGLDPRNLAIMALPATVLGKDRFRPGDTIHLDCSLLTYCAAERIEWKGEFTLRQ